MSVTKKKTYQVDEMIDKEKDHSLGGWVVLGVWCFVV